jgi:L-2-hydroxyglutarate oxidase LhgO
LAKENSPRLFVIVNVTNEESFACKTVIVAAGTGCLAMVSKTTPFILQFFCAEAASQINPEKRILLS